MEPNNPGPSPVPPSSSQPQNGAGEMRPGSMDGLRSPVQTSTSGPAPQSSPNPGPPFREMAKPTAPIAQPSTWSSSLGSQMPAPDALQASPEATKPNIGSLDTLANTQTNKPQVTKVSNVSPDPQPGSTAMKAKLIAGGVAGVVALAGIIGLTYLVKSGKLAIDQKTTAQRYKVTSIPLDQLARSGVLGVDKASQLSVNGQLRVNNAFVLTPTDTPQKPASGQLYLNSRNNQLYYFNGQKFVSLATGDQISALPIGPMSGATAGSGLSLGGGVLTNTGVISLQGLSGSLTLSGTANQVNVGQGGSNITISLPQNISPSSVPTFAGLNLSGPLAVASGGTGGVSFTNNTVLVGNGGGGFKTSNSGGVGDCLMIDGSGAPNFGTCPGGGAISPGASQTPGKLTKFDTTLNKITDSLVSESGSTVTVGGDLAVTGTASGNGSGLTSLNASNVSSGTLADGRLSANVALLNAAQGFTGINNFSNVNNSFTGAFSGNGSALTSLNATNVSSGTLSDSRLSANVALLNASQAFSGNNSFSGANTFSNAANSFTGDGSGLTNLDASNVALGTLADGRLSTNVTLQGNAFNGSSELVQTTGAGALPVLSGINLTNLNAANVASGTLADARLSANVTIQGNTFNGASQLVQLDASTQLPVASGVNLTNLNASSVSSGTLAVSYGGTGSGTAAGARSNLGAAVSGANGDITSLTALTAIAPTSALTIGSTAHSLILQGSTTTLSANSGGFAVTLGFTAPTANQTITLPDSTGVVCLSSGNCIGGGGSGANTSLSNLATVAINTSLLPGTFGTLDLGSNTKPFGNLYLSDAVQAFAYKFTGQAADSNKTITVPTFTGSSATLCLSTGNCSGGAGGITGSGTANTIPVFSGSTAVGNSIVSQNAGATQVTIGGDLAVTGTTTSTGQVNANGGIATAGANINAGAGTVTAGLFSGSGASLTSLNGSNISSGTVADARLSTNVTLQGNTFNGASQLVKTNASGELPAISGTNLTNLNGSSITSGTVADNRLSTNVALLNANQTFSGTNLFKPSSNSATAFRIQNAAASITLFNADTTGSGALTFGVPSTFSSTATVTGQLNANGGIVTNNTNINAGTGTITSGAINGQTISSAASFTGTVSVASLGAAGNTPICWNISNQLGTCSTNAATVTLQQAYNVSANPELVVDATRGALTVRDASTPIGANLLEVQNNAGSTTYLAVAATGASITGSLSVTSSVTAASFSGVGSALTSLNASNISSGTLADARLTSNVALLDRNSQTFTGSNIFKNTSNSTNAFQIQNSLSANLLNADTQTSSNLITQGDFENGYTGWIGRNVGVTSVGNTVGQAWQGYKSLSVGTSSTAGDGVNYTGYTLVQNQQYTLSFYAKVGSGLISDINVGHQNNTTNGEVNCLTAQTFTTSWTRFSCTFQDNTAVNTNYIYIKKTGTGNEAFYIDGVQLQTGASMTPFNPGGMLQLTGLVNSPFAIQNYSDSTTAFQIQNAAGSSNLFDADTINSRIGIGTSSPSAKLEVSGSGGIGIDLIVNGRIQTGDGGSAGGVWLNSADTMFLGQASSTELGLYNNGAWRLVVDNSGNTGIGVGNGSVSSRLVVSGSDSTSNGTGAAIQIQNSASGGASWYIRAGATGTNTPAAGLSISNFSTYMMYFRNTGEVDVPGSLVVGTGAASNCYNLSSTFSTCGSGQTDMTLAGTSSGSPYRFAGLNYVNQTNLTYYSTFYRSSGSKYVLAYTDDSNLTYSELMSIGTAGNMKLLGSLTQNTTPDLAETIPVTADAGAYDVVSADPSASVQATRSSTPYDSKVLGVLSDGSSGIKINSNSTTLDGPDTGKYLVLVGRVPVHVTNEGGPIKIGDYLTSSSTPGYAMKATHAGPTIGKALANFDAASGTVMTQTNLSYYDPASAGVQGSSSQTINQGDAANLSSLTVSGMADVGSLTVEGDSEFKGTVTVDGKAGFKGDVSVAGDLSLGDNSKGNNIPVGNGQTELPVTFKEARSDTNYNVQIEPNWLTAHAVVEKTINGFKILFDKPAPANATLDWILTK